MLRGIDHSMASADDGARRRSRTATTAESLPWTTARCSRLLRPLQSRIAAIRRDLATPGDCSAVLARPAPSPAKNDANSQQQWLIPRKKRYRTYSQRRPHEQSHGEVECPSQPPLVTLRAFRQAEVESSKRNHMYPSTPLLRRTTDQIFSSPIALRNTVVEAADDLESGGAVVPRRRGRKKQTEVNERLTRLRGMCTPGRYADFESIYRSLEALLTASIRSPMPKKGGNSLVEICLRRVPEYIAGVEAWELADADESGKVAHAEGTNTSTRIYNDLEVLGDVTGRNHLRAVVLADGIRTIAMAVEDGLWIHDFTQVLVTLCAQCSAPEESEIILGAMSNRLQFEALSMQSSATRRPDLLPHTSLFHFVRETGRKSFVLGQYRRMITHDGFSMDWLRSDDFDHLWETSIGILSKDAAASHAVALVTTLVISVGRRLPRGTVLRPGQQQGMDIATVQHRTLISALAAMASMSLLGEYGLSESSTNRTRTIRVGGRLRFILQTCIVSFRQQRKHLSHMGYSLACLALLCSSSMARYDDVEFGLTQSLRGLWSERSAPHVGWTPRWREHFDLLVSLLSFIAITCSRGTGDSPQHFLDIFVERLHQLELESEVIDALRTASAFHLAQQTNNVRDLIYAENLHRPSVESRNSGHGPAVTPVKTASSMLFTGYVWDDTIGEWVTATPTTTTLAIRTPARPRVQHDSEDSDDDLSVDRTETPQTHSSIESTPYTVHSAYEARPLDTLRLERRGCIQNRTRQSLPAGFAAIAHTSKHDLLSESEVEIDPVDNVDDSWLEDELALDQNCHDDEDNETATSRASHRHSRAKRRRTHSGLFTLARSESRRRGTTTHSISRGFVDESSSDDELGL